MASEVFALKVTWRHRRAVAIIQETQGKLKRAPRRERPAIFDRCVARMLRECARVEGSSKQGAAS